MGLFDLFKKKDKSTEANKSAPSKPSIPENEQKYYQPDSYYTDVVFKDSVFERKVITFEDRKKTAIPSNRGLYPAEILLLEYCSYGTYPAPKNGYPGFWWFSYGIRNVGAALKSLEDRGYIIMGTAKDSTKQLTVPQLKELLSSKNAPVTGKKADLEARAKEFLSEEELLSAGIIPKYILTDVGQQELIENAYVPYMHKKSNTTTEDDSWGMTFNVWTINKLLGSGDKSNWRAIVDEQENSMIKQTSDRHNASMRTLSKTDPKLYDKLHNQDLQLDSIKDAHAKYKSDNDIVSYISFWEDLWKAGGLCFEGSKWHFELADLYIKAKRYNDALCFLRKLKINKPNYSEKADGYIQKITKLQEKELAKNTR